MKCLLVVAHGSRRAESNDEVRSLAAALGRQAGDRYAAVTAGFLELAEPSIPAGIEECIRRGAKEVVVLPYFLSAGRHVVQDIPAEVDIKRREHPHVNIRIAPYLGSAAGITALLMGLAEAPA